MGYYICYPTDMVNCMILDRKIIELFQLNDEVGPKSQVSGIWLTFNGEIYEAIGKKEEQNEK